MTMSGPEFGSFDKKSDEKIKSDQNMINKRIKTRPFKKFRQSGMEEASKEGSNFTKSTRENH